MRVTIRHVTTYTYAAPVRYSIQSLRLTPPSFEGQRVTRWKIEAPGFERAPSFRDAFGNVAHLVSVAAPHDRLTIAATGTVEVEDRAGVVRGLDEQMPVRVYGRDTALTRPDAALADLAHGLPDGQILDKLHALMARLREKMAYQTGATDARTTAAEALARGKGVCQDFAHAFIGAARCLGLPARYVTGYLAGKEKGESEAHHAWAESWVDGLGWVGFDPANGASPTDRYVRLACGLDALTAAPIRGVWTGASGDTLEVSVEARAKNRVSRRANPL